MSASNVSVTANTRRRTSSAVNDAKQSIDIVTPTTNDTADPNPSKDLSHSMRGEAVLDRPTKEPGPTRPAPKPRARKQPNPTAGKHHPKPRWKTVVSVLVKNLVLLLVVLGLVQMVRRIAVKSVGESGGVSGILGFEDMEGRIAAVEKTVKTTAKMMQVQVEVVDKKIDTQVRNLRGEIGKRVEERGAVIEALVRDVSARSERGIEEVVRMYEELKGDKGGSTSVANLDEVRAVAREVVEREIEKHVGDGLGTVDYALASGGGRIERHSEAFVVARSSVGWIGGIKHSTVDENAVKMLQPSFGEPGMCFAVKGSNGFVQIRLRTSIVPQAITLEHVAKNVAYDQSSAPKHCRVFGWLQGQQGLETNLKADADKVVLIAEFMYDLEKSNAQTYEVLDSARFAVIDTVRFDFSSNHGSPTHTCIYRFRVHGHESSAIPQLGADS